MATDLLDRIDGIAPPGVTLSTGDHGDVRHGEGRPTVTEGWIGRHTPRQAGAGGRDAAIIDAAQDLVWRDLAQRGALDALAFEGGAARRKRYAGNHGRFSTDPDLVLVHATDDPGGEIRCVPGRHGPREDETGPKALLDLPGGGLHGLGISCSLLGA